jgi:hypothetical protein
VNKTKLYYLFLLISFALQAQAQTTITGTVKSATGEALIGSSILIKSTSSGTRVNVDGTFTLQIDNKLKMAFTGC